MTGGALLGIKLIGRNAEHVVALDTYAMDDRANDRAWLDGLCCACRSCAGSMVGSGLCGHGEILARGCSEAKRDYRHPNGAAGASLYMVTDAIS